MSTLKAIGRRRVVPVALPGTRPCSAGSGPGAGCRTDQTGLLRSRAALRSAALILVCQLVPMALKCASTSWSRRSCDRFLGNRHSRSPTLVRAQYLRPQANDTPTFGDLGAGGKRRRQRRSIVRVSPGALPTLLLPWLGHTSSKIRHTSISKAPISQPRFASPMETYSQAMLRTGC